MVFRENASRVDESYFRDKYREPVAQLFHISQFVTPYSSLPRTMTRTSVLLPLQNHRERHESEHGRLQPGVFAEENGHVAHKRHISQHTSNNILLAVEEALAARVKLCVVCSVVVTLCQEL
jgi:hypothetical protein